MALLESDGPGHGRAVRIEAAWDTQLYQWVPAQPGFTYLATARLRGASSPGNDAGLVLTFLAASGEVLASAAQWLPKGSTAAWRPSALGDLAPPEAGWVGFGVSGQRQQAGDWLEAGDFELHAARGDSGP